MIRKIPVFLMQTVFPARCPFCDEIVIPYGEKICSDCIKKIKYVTPPWCMKCGKKMNEEGDLCNECISKEHFFDRGRALYEYDSIVDGIYKFKYAGRKEYARVYGEEMAKYLGEFVKSCNADLIIPIPLHKSRQKKRGYNQASLIARCLSDMVGIPVREDILIRSKNTIPLKKLNRYERQNNLKKAFNIGKNDVKLKTIILIDDIFTTGSTIDEASRVLKSAGADKIYFITLSCGASV